MKFRIGMFCNEDFRESLLEYLAEVNLGIHNALFEVGTSHKQLISHAHNHQERYDVLFVDNGFLRELEEHSVDLFYKTIPLTVLVVLGNKKPNALKANPLFPACFLNYSDHEQEIRLLIAKVVEKLYVYNDGISISVMCGKTKVGLRPSQISYISKGIKKCIVHLLYPLDELRPDKVYRINDALENIAKKLRQYHFVLCHDSTLVNLLYAKVETFDLKTVVVANQKKLKISPSKSKQFLLAYRDFYNRKTGINL